MREGKEIPYESPNAGWTHPEPARPINPEPPRHNGRFVAKPKPERLITIGRGDASFVVTPTDFGAIKELRTHLAVHLGAS